MHASATAHDIDCLSCLYMCHVVNDNCTTAAHWTLCCCAVRFCYHSCPRNTITIVHHKTDQDRHSNYLHTGNSTRQEYRDLSGMDKINWENTYLMIVTL